MSAKLFFDLINIEHAKCMNYTASKRMNLLLEEFFNNFSEDYFLKEYREWFIELYNKEKDDRYKKSMIACLKAYFIRFFNEKILVINSADITETEFRADLMYYVYFFNEHVHYDNQNFPKNIHEVKNLFTVFELLCSNSEVVMEDACKKIWDKYSGINMNLN